MDSESNKILESLLKKVKPMNDFVETIEPEEIIEDDENDIIEPEEESEEDAAE